MHSISKLESPTSNSVQADQYPKAHNPYAKMSNRRIACTICAKAKTKCDKLIPSCTRCTSKGLTCEPRSTRRTSDNSYRNTKKHLVSPKRYSSTSSMPAISRHTSPRSVPSSSRHQLGRTVSQMDFHTAVKLGQQQHHFGTMPMLTPYTPQIIDECYSYSSSPEQSMSAFSRHHMDKSNYLHSGRMTPQTPESFMYSEPLLNADPLDQYINAHSWSDEAQMTIGLGFENDIPGLLPSDPDMRWTPEFSGSSTPVPNVRYESSVCESPASIHAWPNHSASLSPPQHPHARAVPSLSISDCSVAEGDSPNGSQDEWSNFQGVAHDAVLGEPNSTAECYSNPKCVPQVPQIWGDSMIPRSSTF